MASCQILLPRLSLIATKTEEIYSLPTNQVGVNVKYNLDSLFTFVRTKVKNELIKTGKGEELIVTTDLSLETLFAYYKTKNEVVGEYNFTFLSSNAGTKRVFLSKLQILSFQVASIDGKITLLVSWDQASLKQFLKDVIERRYRIQVKSKVGIE